MLTPFSRNSCTKSTRSWTSAVNIASYSGMFYTRGTQYQSRVRKVYCSATLSDKCLNDEGKVYRIKTWLWHDICVKLFFLKLILILKWQNQHVNKSWMKWVNKKFLLSITVLLTDIIKNFLSNFVNKIYIFTYFFQFQFGE